MPSLFRPAAAAVAIAIASSGAWGQPSTAFIYQGQLRHGGALVNGTADVRARLYNAAVGGTQVGATLTVNNVPVTDGAFSVELGFLASELLAADNLFLELDVRSPAGVGGFVTLAPRQPLRPAPLATRASGARDAFDVHNMSGQATVQLRGDRNSDGGVLYTRSEDGFMQLRAEPDIAGEGLFVVFQRTNSQAGLVFDGHTTGTGDPVLTLTGTVSAVVFDMGKAGNASVVLPPGAINSLETFDEPGVANAQAGTVVLSTTAGPLVSRSITVPGPGFVLAMAQGDLAIGHVNGTTSNVVFGVSDEPATLPVNQDIQVVIPDTSPTDGWDIPASAHGLFAVPAAGTYTYYFVGVIFTGAGSATMFDCNLTLVYFPTAYGPTSPNLPRHGNGPDDELGAARPGPTPAELAAERRAAEQFAQDRREREVALLREQVRRINEALERIEREQAAERHPAE